MFEELNKVNKTMTIQEHLAVDEMMIEYFGRHGCKQFIRGKPIRFGFEIWSLASSSGFVYQMEPYADSHTRLVETGLGQGPSVVLGLAEKAGVPPGCKFYHGNLFTTLTLVDEMTKRGYGSCGTLRENRLFDIQLTPAKSFQKTSRGNAEFLIEDGKLIVRWNDNSVVTVVTNMENKYSDVDTQRWNKQKHAMDKVKGVKMGFIQYLKWHDTKTKHVFINYHLIIRSCKEGDRDLLSFQRLVAQSLLQCHGMRPQRHRRRSVLGSAICEAARFDNLNHWPHNTGRKYMRCRKCDGRTPFACEKCGVALHVERFKKFHANH